MILLDKEEKKELENKESENKEEKDNKFILLNVRYVNYKITENGSYVNIIPKSNLSIQTVNMALKLGLSFKILNNSVDSTYCMYLIMP